MIMIPACQEVLNMKNTMGQPIIRNFKDTLFRKLFSNKMNTTLAVEKAVNESIQEGILKEFLLQNKSEAIQMSIFEFDEEREMKLIREDEREIGREEGLKKGIKQGLEEGVKKGIDSSINLLVKYDLAHNVAEEVIIQKVIDIFGISHNDVVSILQNVVCN